MSFSLSPGLTWLGDQAPAMRALLEAWSNINSGSNHAAGLHRQAEAIAAAFAPLGATRESIPLAGAGEAPVLRLSKRPQARVQVLLAGHYDTVYPEGHSFQRSEYDPGTRILRGPGVADMKGGLVILLHTLLAFEREPCADQVGWEVLLNPDEELGSPGSDAVFTRAATRHDLAFVYEPTLPNGDLVSARKGSGNFEVTAAGRAVHAGRDFERGRNAIRLIADFVAQADNLNGRRAGVTLNVGRVDGGGPLNIVPDHATCGVNVRTTHPSDEEWVKGELDGIITQLGARDGFSLRMTGHFTSPPKPVTPSVLQLLEGLAHCGADLGLPPLHWEMTGGACDGNRLAACGLPTVDSMGIHGGGLHSMDEFAYTDSLVERARLSALFLTRLAQGDYPIPERSWNARAAA